MLRVELHKLNELLNLAPYKSTEYLGSPKTPLTKKQFKYILKTWPNFKTFTEIKFAEEDFRNGKKEDFCGLYLRGSDLSNVDLTGANLKVASLK